MNIFEFALLIALVSSFSWLAGAGVSGIVFKRIKFSVLRGGNVDRKNKKAKMIGLCFLIAFIAFPFLLFQLLIEIYGFFSFQVLISLLFTGTSFVMGVTHVVKLTRLFVLKTLVLGILAFFFLLYGLNYSLGNVDVINRNTELIEEKAKYSSQYTHIFTTTFPKIRECTLRYDYKYCKNMLQNEINTLNIPKRYTYYFIQKCPSYSGSHARVQEESAICKLFKSGDFTRTVVSSPGEQRVYQILEGKQKYKPNNFRMNEIFTTSRYLFDLYSEAEIIVPVTADGEIIGAIVELYAD